MKKILLVLNFMAEFIASETGFVRQRTGLPVAWATGVLVVVAIFFGMPDKAHAACGWLPDVTCGSDSYCWGLCVHPPYNCSGGSCEPYGSVGDRCKCY